MILSFHNQFVFFPIPKTGSQSIRDATRPFLGDLDWEQCSLFEKKLFPVPALASLKHGHISYMQLQECVLLDILESYFKFCFVRNPLDRFVSFCYFINRDNNSMAEKPLARMKEMISNTSTQQHILFQPQNSFICNEVGELKMDFIGRYEQLETDFQKICSQIGIPFQPLKQVNQSKHKDKKLELNTELKEMVYNFYKKDFELFGYSL